MKNNNKPDNVVFNTKTQTYDAALKPYATSVGAPVITITDTTEWKNRSISKFNHKVNTQFKKLREEYEALIEEYEYNHIIYNSKFSFEPIPGKTYHLYSKANGETFLSLISPTECNFNTLGSFYLNADLLWKRV